MEKEIINVYNHFHNGDLFYSRVLIQQLLKKYNVCVYHNQRSPLFEDMLVQEIVGIPHNFPTHGCIKESNVVNSWIGKNNFLYCNNEKNGPGCSFENYFGLVEDICNYYKIDLPITTDDMLPYVEYSKVKNNNIVVDKMCFYKNKYRKIVLICNGPVMSGQSNNFDFNPYIELLSSTNKDVLFIMTNGTNIEQDNVITSDSITEKVPDLLLISLISTYCNIIVGRASGPYCFTHTRENIMNLEKTYISFTNLSTEGIWYHSHKCKNLWSNDYSYNNIYNTLYNEIKIN